MRPYVLLVHGQRQPGSTHWQGWLAGQLAEQGATVEIPEFDDPDAPVLDAWLTELREHLALAPAGVPRIVVAHALGATLWLHHAASTQEAKPALRMDRVLLVAPVTPDPEHKHFPPAPLDPAGLRRVAASTRLVVAAEDDTKLWANRLDIECDLIQDGGRLDVAAGYGPWPAVLDWVQHGHSPVIARSKARPSV